MTNSSTGKQMRLSTGARPYLGVGLGVTISSTAAILIRLAQAEAPSLVIAAWRLTLATLILAPVTLSVRRSELRGLARREWASVVASGLLLAIHFGTWISSLAYTSVAASAVLVSAYPIFVGLASHLLLHERLSRAMVVALLAAMAGAYSSAWATWERVRTGCWVTCWP
jgi:drug/metabolite transporter (DMT)-like permease